MAIREGDIIVTTAPYVAGYRVVRVLGVALGLTAPALKGEGSAPTGAFPSPVRAPTGAASQLRPRRQSQGGAGSLPAKLARAQLHSKFEAKAYKRSYPPPP